MEPKHLKSNGCPKHRYQLKEYVCTKCKAIYCNICLHQDGSHKSSAQLISDQLLSSYEFEQFLGKGGFGSVFKVTSLSDGLPYAIKVINIENEEDFNTFSLESQIHAAISHQNIIKYISSFRIPKESLFVIILELAENSLRSKIATLTQDEAFDYFMEIIEALFYLHVDKKIVHRDLKPENILLKNNSIKISDLGSAKLMSPNRSYGGFAATPEYLPPEVLNQKKRPYENSDIWACGIIFHEMLSNGKHPFDPENLKNRNSIIENIKKGNRAFDKSIQNKKYADILESTQYFISFY